MGAVIAYDAGRRKGYKQGKEKAERDFYGYPEEPFKMT